MIGRPPGLQPRPFAGAILAAFSLASTAADAQLSPARAAVIRLDVTRDAWVSAVGREADGNNGGAPRLKLKSIQEMALVDIDARPLVGKTIRSAVLHIKKAGDEPVRRVTIGGVGAEWFEGVGSGYAVQAGGATFRHRRHPDLPWSIDGGDLTNVVLGNGGTTWRMADASPADPDGWQHVPVDPQVVATRVAGLSHGFLVFDDNGTEWTRAGETFTLRPFPNRFFYSRDQNRASAPYFTVEPGPDDRQAPPAPVGLRVEPETARLPPGEALVSWVTPPDNGLAGTLGSFATLDGRDVPRELIPLAARPGARVEMHLRDLKIAGGTTVKLRVRAVDAAGNLGPAAALELAVSHFIPTPLPRPSVSKMPRQVTPLPRLGDVEVAIIDELDKVHQDTGALIPDEPDGYLAANHLWDASVPRINLQAARNEFVAFQVLLRSTSRFAETSIRPELVFDGPARQAIQVDFGRYQTVATPLGLLPDPIVPLTVPDGPTPGAKNQGLHVELYVPHSLAAGTYRGTLTLRSLAAGRVLALALPVVLKVWDFTLPDHLSFLPEMNCYGLPENERDYYRLAHRHRTVLNRVPYSQRGEVHDGCAPTWDNRRFELDWTAWDRRFGPLLDGSAFADLPRKGVPIECFYLPLHENWPTPMDGHYNGDPWADRAFPESYRRSFVAAARQIAAHLQAKGWTETLFQGFLNNKVDFKARGWSRGSSPWLLDEPANFQDYWALRYFAKAFHEGINQASGSKAVTKSPKLVFRADISRPQWRRDTLDGLLDYHVVGGASRTYPRLVFDRKRALGEIVLEYGSTNPVEGSNLQPAGWCLDTWSLGGDGVVPWQTVGDLGSWERGDELSLFYPGRVRTRTGSARPAAPAAALPVPVPSIRLKAYRRGQQDVEYLALWSTLRNQPRWAIGPQVRAALNLAGRRQGTGVAAVEDAGRIDYARLRPRDLWALRNAIGESLSPAHPAFKSQLVDFRTPRRDPNHLPPAEVGAHGPD